MREELQSNQQELERGEEIIEAMAEKVSREKEDGSREEGGTRFPIESNAHDVRTPIMGRGVNGPNHATPPPQHTSITHPH